TVIQRMMAKKPADRYSSLGEVAEALGPWTQTEIGPPAESEMPSRQLTGSSDVTATVVSKATPAPATAAASAATIASLPAPAAPPRSHDPRPHAPDPRLRDPAAGPAAARSRPRAADRPLAGAVQVDITAGGAAARSCAVPTAVVRAATWSFVHAAARSAAAP